jgi:hypothetical protein
MLTRKITVAEAMATGTVHVTGGDENTMDTFISMFALPDQPAPERSLV